MKQYLLYLWPLLLACSTIGTETSSPASPWQTEAQYLQTLTPTILKQDGPEIHQYWVIRDEDALWQETLPEFEAILKYRDSVLLALGSELYEKEKHIHQAVPQGEPDSSYRGDKGNRDIIADGHVGLIRPMQALETHLLNYQLNRFPLFSHPTEFLSFILRHPGGKIKVYFTASNTPWPPKAVPVIQEIMADTAQGWELYQVLHNHYEDAEENYFGAMAPSMPDVQYLRWLREQFQMQEGVVINGFQTTVIPAKDLDLLHGDGE